nr:MAG TPA: hypothetical protein [Caudoviricetes sp.]
MKLFSANDILSITSPWYKNRRVTGDDPSIHSRTFFQNIVPS